MSAVDSNFYKKKKNWSFYVWVWFLTFTILITGGLYLFTTNVQAENQELLSQIADFDARITEERSDKNVQVYSIYEQHKGLLEQISKRSDIPLFVLHLKNSLQKYWLTGKWFSYNDGIVNMNIESETGKTEYAYQKIVSMLEEYALDENALFEVAGVTSFSGHDEISFSWEFQLK